MQVSFDIPEELVKRIKTYWEDINDKGAGMHRREEVFNSLLLLGVRAYYGETRQDVELNAKNERAQQLELYLQTDQS